MAGNVARAQASTANTSLHRLSWWLTQSPTSFGFSRELDQQAKDAHNAAVILTKTSQPGHWPKPDIRARLVGILLDALRDGLARRVGYVLTELEISLVAQLADVVAVAASEPADRGGVIGLRVCGRCGVVFEAPRARVCAPCYRFNRSPRESQSEADDRLRNRGLLVRAINELVGGELGTVASLPGARCCSFCSEPIPDPRPDQLYCSHAHRQSALRARTHAQTFSAV